MSYINTRGTRSVRSSSDIFACYCCSGCLNPVIAHLTVGSVQSGSTSKLFGTSAEELQQQAATEKEKRYEGLKAFLAEPKAETFPEEGVEGLDAPCPFCGSQEPWQRMDTLWLAEAVGPIETRNTLTEGYAWAQQVLRERKLAADNAQRDLALQQQDRQRLSEIEAGLSACAWEKTSGVAAKELAAQAEKEAALRRELDGMGLFSKGKKEVRAELEQCQKVLAAAQDKQKTVSQQMDILSAKLNREKKELGLLDKPYRDRAMYSEGKRRFALRLCEGEEQPETAVSLRPLPEIGRYSVSEFEKENRESLAQTVNLLNEAIRAAGIQEESK